MLIRRIRIQIPPHWEQRISAAIRYYEIAKLPRRKFFRCERLLANLHVEACGEMWIHANTRNDEARRRCKGCPLGAVHAGEPDANLSYLRGSNVCSRCQRMATRLVNGELCISCQNRQYEWINQRNAKGNIPSEKLRLDARCLRYVDGDAAHFLRRSHSRNLEELMISVVRRASQCVVFGWNPIQQLNEDVMR